jgi:hypothetical protein
MSYFASPLFVNKLYTKPGVYLWHNPYTPTIFKVTDGSDATQNIKLTKALDFYDARIYFQGKESQGKKMNQGCNVILS